MKDFGKKEARLYIRVTEQEKKHILSRMRKAGMVNMSEYARQMILKGQITVNEYGGLRELAAQIGKIGTNVNQVAKRANERRHVPQEDVEELMLCLKQVLSLLERTAKKIMKE